MNNISNFIDYDKLWKELREWILSDVEDEQSLISFAKDNPYPIIEQDCWFDLDNNEVNLVFGIEFGANESDPVGSFQSFSITYSFELEEVISYNYEQG